MFLGRSFESRRVMIAAYTQGQALVGIMLGFLFIHRGCCCKGRVGRAKVFTMGGDT
jgi:hypothetical protein